MTYFKAGKIYFGRYGRSFKLAAKTNIFNFKLSNSKVKIIFALSFKKRHRGVA